MSRFNLLASLLFSLASSPAVLSRTVGVRDALGLYSGPQTGQATFYEAGLGACGMYNNDGDFIAAASTALFDNYPGYNGNPNANPMCGQLVTVRSKKSGASVVVSLVDRCGGCAPTDLDLTPEAFAAIANLDDGRIDITWTWNTPPQ